MNAWRSLVEILPRVLSDIAFNKMGVWVILVSNVYHISLVLSVD